ncbi:hypothetical protein ACET3Z_031793 [Daucus carota]
MGSNTSKWLREDGAGEWSKQVGRDNVSTNTGFQNPTSTHPVTSTRIHRGGSTVHADISGHATYTTGSAEHKEGNSNVFECDGPDTDEHYGLNLEERKRQWREVHTAEPQTKYQDKQNKDSTLSDTDCVETSPSFLAKLALERGLKGLSQWV